MAKEDENLTYDENDDIITLTLDDGKEIECAVLAVFPVNDNNYIALLPQDADDEGEVYLYRFIQHDDDEIELINIEDDDEFDAVSDAFDEMLDDEELNEMLAEEDGEEE
ncbi:MAG TPA: DUF1292 domain-containing protein [Candidatus Caccomorpha excrementavium]|nr:DUF1292 domain-containing protein [Candidatus Caccomorpha excrementavium]